MRIDHHLTEQEIALYRQLPIPPAVADFQTNFVCIIEWLPDDNDEPRTGLQLHEWMETSRKWMSTYRRCGRKREVIAAIQDVVKQVRQSGLVPVLHLEAHGAEDGLGGPDGSGNQEILRWDELTEPLQDLNVATRCNLIVVVAACIGYAAVRALSRGPRAPAVAVVGPIAPVLPRNLIQGMKELYRRWKDESPSLANIAKSASEQAGTVGIEWEPFTGLVYEACVTQLILSARPKESRPDIKAIPQLLQAMKTRSTAKIDSPLTNLAHDLPNIMQHMWNEMFMIDLYPENQVRFGLDMRAIVHLIVSKTSGATS